MDYGRSAFVIEEFLHRHPGKDFCLDCVIEHAPISIKEDQVLARHVFLTSEWTERAKLGVCARCERVKETWRSRLPIA